MEFMDNTNCRASESESMHQNSEVCGKTEPGSASMSVNEEHNSQPILQNTMLDHLASSKTAYFKSQQVGEPELSFEQKREIAENILLRNPGQFLARFGHFLLSQHLEYFTELDKHCEDYEITFHLKQLQRFHCKEKNDVDVKNRRFEALKKLVQEGTYFSEKEMKLRNPLLYQQLVGQYLSRKEVEDRKNADRADVTSWVSLLLAQIERDQMLCLRKKQKDDEDGAIEEMDTSDEEEKEEEEEEDDEEEEDEEEEEEEEEESEKEEDDIDDNDGNSDGSRGSKHENGKISHFNNRKKENKRDSFSKPHKKRKLLPGKEKDLLREEFISNMYRSFLEGKDQDFDYSQVDSNPEYECLAVRSQDEEEKYFDSETPELVADEKCSDGEEDELDAYMKNLKPESTPAELAGKLNIML